MSLWNILAIPYILILPLLQATLGTITIVWLYKLFRLNVKHKDVDLACAFIIGLFFQLFLALLIKIIGLNWWIATFLPLLPVLTNVKVIIQVFEKCWPVASVNFLLWFFVIVATGLSILSFNDEFYTAWSNNYGDVAFHIGMINSFIFGENFPPQYHIFAGETLSYPFLINFWTALLWWLQPEFDLLPFVFLVQWTLVWFLVYHFVSGAKYFLMPWAIFLGGGTYYLLGEYSYLSLNKGYPWVAFLGSIWIPQRTFLLGLAGVLFIIWIAYRGLTGSEKYFLEEPKRLLHLRATLIGLFSGFALLTHGHAILVAALFIGVSAFFFVIAKYLQERTWSSINLQFESLFLILITATIAFAFISPWLLAKSNMFALMPGWLVSSKAETIALGLLQSSKMWLLNAGYCVVLLFPVIVFGKFVKESIAALSIFFLFNFVRLAHWDWDQIKLFITLYVIVLAIWSASSDRFIWRLHLLCFILIIPGFTEGFKTFQEGPHYTIYSKEVIAQAEKIKSATSTTSILAAAPDHNSVVTLTGRKLYTGYPGTIWTHGLSQEREAILKDLPRLVKCKQERKSPTESICPDYLVWTQAEQRYWPGQSPQSLGLKPVVQDLLYILSADDI